MHLDEERDERRHGAQAGAGLLPQADELPDAQPDLPVARPVLPRAAAAAVRVRHRLPLREVRRRARADPGPRHDPGRRAHLLHPRADAGRAGLPAAASSSTCCATTASTTSTSSCPPGPGEVRRLRRGVGGGHRDAARGRRAAVRAGLWCPTRAARLLRPEDLRPGARRDRPHLADVDHPAGLQPAASASTSSTRPPTAPGSGR